MFIHFGILSVMFSGKTDRHRHTRVCQQVCISTQTGVPRCLLNALIARIFRRLVLGESQVTSGHFDFIPVKGEIKIHRG